MAINFGFCYFSNERENMDTEKISEKLEKIATKKAIVARQEKGLKQREKKIRDSHLIQLGKLIQKAGIEHLEMTTLFGALSFIKDAISDPKNKQDWTEKGEFLLKEASPKKGGYLVVTLPADSPTDAKKLLKELRFRWNQFRKEWYGYGDAGELEKTLSSFQGKVEVVPE